MAYATVFVEIITAIADEPIAGFDLFQEKCREP
jgi:hypothetical protein